MERVCEHPKRRVYATFDREGFGRGPGTITFCEICHACLGSASLELGTPPFPMPPMDPRPSREGEEEVR